MLLVPENAGSPNAGSEGASPAGGVMAYVNVPLEVPAKLNVNVPTRVAADLGPSGWPFVTYAAPCTVVGEVQVPPGITIQSGLKRPGFAASACLGSYVYHTAKTWLLPVCWVKLTPQPDSAGRYQRSV